MDIQILEATTDGVQIILNGQIAASRTRSHSCRNVYLFPDFVLKLDSLFETKQNASEAFFYKYILEEEDTQYFPKFLGSGQTEDGRTYLVQERIEINECQVPTEKQTEIFHRIKNKYKIDDVGIVGQLIFNHTSDYNHNVTPVGEDGLMFWDIGRQD
jgi:hypothetical protein